MAVIDSGLDTSNPDFPALFLNRRGLLQLSHYGDDVANTVTGHGTHVTGSLLGRGVNSALYKGVAPGANLVFIKVGNDTDGTASSNAVTYAIRDAVDVYHAKIINLSLGTWSEYHDGSDQTCQAVDYATSQGASVFVAAGNNASEGWHYSGTVAANSTTGDIPITIASGASSYLAMNLVWYDNPQTNLSLQYYDSNHTLLAATNSGQSESARLVGSALYIFNTTVSAGTYYLRVQNASSNSQLFHIYYMGGATSVTFSSPNPNYTICSPAEGDSAIAIGAYVTRSNWTNYKGTSYSCNPPENAGSIAVYSSRGPRVESGSPGKPDIVAPGSAVISSRDSIYTLGNANFDPYIIKDSGSNNGNPPATYYVMEGTSMASPMAAGVGALLLSSNPHLSSAQIKAALETTATEKGSSGFDNIYGWGLINANAAMSFNPILSSFLDISHSTASNVFDLTASQNTVYLYGSGYLPNHSYLVTYFDGSDLETNSTSITTDASGTISSQNRFIGNTGIWHAVVSEPQFVPNGSYNANWDYSIVVDSFTLINSGQNYTLTIAVNGNGNTLPSVGSHDYVNGTVLTVSATPASGWQFSSWTYTIGGVTKEYYSTTVAITVNGNQTVTANFIQNSDLPGKIVFTSSRDSGAQIYWMDAGGANQTRLTSDPAGGWSPSWSSDGAKIVYVVQPWGDNNQEIYSMNADGSNSTNLTHFPILSGGQTGPRIYSPMCSHDGKKIAYIKEFSGIEIDVMNLDGSNNKTILTNASQYDQNLSLTWSPDSTSIAFTSYDSTGYEIYKINADGTNLTRLTSDSHAEQYPAWSPNGTKIAFQSTTSSGTNIYVMNPDGSNIKQVSANGGGGSGGMLVSR